MKLKLPKINKLRASIIGASVFLVSFGIYFYFNSAIFFRSIGVNGYSEQGLESETKETKVISPLSGILVSSSVARRRPIGSMIENSSFGARPQSGLDNADFVYEALAEGGITRFYAVFHSREAKEIGPVRSARPYYVTWAAGLRATYAHIGQSPEGLMMLKSMGDSIVPDINFGFRFADGYKRVSWRFAPHNVYSTTKDIRKLANAIKKEKPEDYPRYYFKDDLAASLRPNKGKNLRIDFGTFFNQYSARYDYDKASNNYKRFVGDDRHIDRVSKKQLLVKNIIVEYHDAPTLYPSGHSRLNIKTTGSGRGLLFRDGKAIHITWSKKDSKAQTIYKTADDNIVLLNKGGTTWVDIVFPQSKVSF